MKENKQIVKCHESKAIRYFISQINETLELEKHSLLSQTIYMICSNQYWS